jgi:hypothetical protein
VFFEKVTKSPRKPGDRRRFRYSSRAGARIRKREIMAQ